MTEAFIWERSTQSRDEMKNEERDFIATADDWCQTLVATKTVFEYSKYKQNKTV